jgi:hypothetical protein
VASSRELYDRGAATLVASWEAYAGGSDGARVLRSADVAVAVFPSAPGRAVYNNAPASALRDRTSMPSRRTSSRTPASPSCPTGLLDRVDDRRFHVLVARDGGEPVSTGIAFDRDGDCGIYNVGDARAGAAARSTSTPRGSATDTRPCCCASV